MVWIPQKQVWTRQPQYPWAVDWSNPITRGLTYCNGGVAAQPVRWYRGTRPTPYGLGVVLSPGITFTNAEKAGFTEGTMLTIPYWPALEYKQPHMILQNIYTSYGDRARICWSGSYSGALDMTVTIGAVTHISTSVAESVARGKVLALSGGPSGLYAYVDGKVAAQSAETTWASSFLASSSGVMLGFGYENLGGGSSCSQPRVWQAYYNRQLNHDEVAALAANPWQIFAP